MSVFIFEPDAFAKLCQVEGEEYREEAKENFSDSSFNAFKKHWEDVNSKNPEIKEECKDVAIKINKNPSIYGLGGYNRYIVYYSGEIVLLKSSAKNRIYIERAKEVGFKAK
ncbi:MAG: hypothetical protein KAS87_05195 [Candidatus Omnitrophica bacterium]|nr:hypothetical protein [Candidatus Omnitrophota bacterium]